MKHSIFEDREAWWTKKAEEMEATNNAGNVRKFFQLNRTTGPHKRTVSETNEDRQGMLISNKEKQLDQWVKHFEEQLNTSPESSFRLRDTERYFKPQASPSLLT